MNLAGLIQSVLLIVRLTQMGSVIVDSIQIQVPEEKEANVWVGSLSPAFPPPYRLLTEDYFRLDSETGNLFTTSTRLDREALCQESKCVLLHNAIVGPTEELVQFTVVLEDINDNAPRFRSAEIRKSILEDTEVGTRISLDELAEDIDVGGNKEVEYRLEGAKGVFRVEVEDGSELMLVVNIPLDRETQDLYQMTLVATDHGAVPLSGTTSIVIEVTDVDDNCPVFMSDSPRIVTLPMDSARGSMVATVRASDLDLGSNAAISYSFSPTMSSRAWKLFSLDPLSGEIHVAEELQSDSSEELVLRVLAIGPHCPPADTKVTVTLLPVARRDREIRIKFIAQNQNQTITLQENQPPSVLALLEVVGDGGRSVDQSLGDGGRSAYLSLSLENKDQPFSLNLQNSKYLLSTSKSLDYEEKREYAISIVARRSDTPGVGGNVHSRTELRVVVEDMNDNAPEFLQSEYWVEVEENNQAGAVLLQVQARDADLGLNSRLIYRLGQHTPAIFKLDPLMAWLTVSEPLDREQQETYVLTVLARDSGSPALETAVTVSVRVLDQNDNAPLFHTPHFIFFIPESVPLLAQVGKVGVSDADAGVNGEVEVRVVNGSGPFVMDNAQGTLRCTDTIDRERQAHYDLSLIATDHGGPLPLSSMTRVTIFIEDINDNQPKVILPSSNLSCVTVSPTTATGTMVFKIFAVDADSGMNSKIIYTVVAREPADQTSPFLLDAHLGNVTLQRHLQANDQRMHHLFIVVSDGGKPSPLHTTIWLNLLVNQTSERCQLDSVPSALPYPLPIQNSLDTPSVCQGEEHGRLIFIVGLGLVGASGLLFLGAMVLYLKHRNREQTQRRRKPCDENEVPLRLREEFYSSEHG